MKVPVAATATTDPWGRSGLNSVGTVTMTLGGTSTVVTEPDCPPPPSSHSRTLAVAVPGFTRYTATLSLPVAAEVEMTHAGAGPGTPPVAPWSPRVPRVRRAAAICPSEPDTTIVAGSPAVTS